MLLLVLSKILEKVANDQIVGTFLDKKLAVSLVSIDFSKAFDKINRMFLLTKLTN